MATNPPKAAFKTSNKFMKPARVSSVPCWYRPNNDDTLDTMVSFPVSATYCRFKDKSFEKKHIDMMEADVARPVEKRHVAATVYRPLEIACVLPALKPNQPNQSKKVPRKENIIECPLGL
mmetsp:Transcript_27637/g.67218  ORF Transcript_27637/g.67218 Transcript_27637/m.67218 type:complete len:120 (-) Transcript_27637:677-1036(-)